MAHSTRILAPHIDLRLRSTIAMGEEPPPPTLPVAVAAAASGGFPSLAQPLLNHPSIMSLAGGDGGSSSEGAIRHVVGDLHGVGTTGEVFSVSDSNLERIVAMKIIPPEHSRDRDAITHLIEEARITASLAHPNVLPVYDLDLDATGRAYFSMKRIDGRSLGDVLSRSTLTQRDPAIVSANAVVTIFIGICQALAYAHRRRIVHQDIKPENIMLGEFGEVLVVDWGSAERLRPGVVPRLYGTPLYMSPEQARNEAVDERSDVYCLGATLLHVLLLRLPMWSEDIDRFWQQKKSGRWDPITPEERRLAAPALVSIAVKALSALPEDRYATCGEMLIDLQAYQAGLVVSAHRDSVLERLRRWHRRHGRQVWITMLILVLAGALCGVIVEERAKEQASWGQPTVAEDFTGSEGVSPWLTISGGFHQDQGHLVSTGDETNLIIYNRKFVGATAMEYDAESLPGLPTGDLSAVWCPDLKFDPDRKAPPKAPTLFNFQFGANDGIFTLITAQGPGWGGREYLAYSTLREAPGKTYHVRVEIADNRLEFWVDGVLACSWTQPFAFTSGYLGLFGYYEGKSFSHVRIYSRGIPQKVSAIAIGDSYVQNGQLEEAANQYSWLAASNPGTVLAREATYKQGICRYQQGFFDDAFAIWKPLRNSEYAARISCQDIDRLAQQQRFPEALAAVTAAFPTANAATRDLLTRQWARYAWGLVVTPGHPLLRTLLDFHDRFLMDRQDQNSIAAHLLFALGRYQQVLDRYPDQRVMCAVALMDLHEYRRMYDDYPEQVFPRLISSFYLGFVHEELLKRGGYFYGLTCWHEREFDRAWAVSANHPETRVSVLAYQGKTAEALAISANTPFERACTLANAGMFQQLATEVPHYPMRQLLANDPQGAMASNAPTDPFYDMAKNLLGLRAWIAGDHRFPAGFIGPIDADEAIAFSNTTFVRFAMPFLQDLSGEHGCLERSCQLMMTSGRWRNRQRYYYQAAYLMGHIDDATYLVHPWRLFAPAELELLHGITSERAGHPTQALAAYEAWNARPYYEQDEFPNPAWHEFVEWRILVLSGTPAAHRIFAH